MITPTKIEWVRNPDGTQGITRNPVKGYCPMACPYCYARAMYDRFKWDKAIRFDQKVLDEIATLKKPTTIFVGSTIELFGQWVEDGWMQTILDTVASYPQHTFIFLTKCPWNLAKWNPWPDNAWVGATATNSDMALTAMNHLSFVDAPVRYLSLEPLLGRMGPIFEPLPKGMEVFTPDQLIIGAQTNPTVMPEKSWVFEILEAADRAGIPIFLKDNLRWPEKRQEFPK